jgi:hypothetical protein
LHKLGNKVVISGRRKSNLDATTQANPGMHSVELDIADSANIAAVGNRSAVGTTDLLNTNEEPRAMPLKEFIEGTMKALGTDGEEILVEQAKPFRNNPGPNESALVTQFNDMMIAASPR